MKKNENFPFASFSFCFRWLKRILRLKKNKNKVTFGAEQ